MKSYTVKVKQFLFTRNYAVSFYLLGSLIFFFNSMRINKIDKSVFIPVLILYILISLVLVYWVY